MRNFQFVLLGVGMALSMELAADGPLNGDVVPIAALRAFAPVGFDDNDSAIVVIDGYLPSGCYRLARPEVEVDHNNKVVRITPMARFFDFACVDALIPFNQEISLGMLPVGHYEILVLEGAIKESLDIAEATNAGPDDYLYAPVDSANVERDPQTNKLSAKIEGRLTNSCMRWREIKVIDTGKTINLLPILDVTDDGTCSPVEVPFSKVIDIPESVTNGRHLLHVRSLNGQAVNQLFYKNT